MTQLIQISQMIHLFSTKQGAIPGLAPSILR